jgi:protein TonB
MTADVIEQPGEGTDLVAAFRAAAPTVRERRFWIMLSIAFLAHAMVLAGIVRSPPTQMGDPNAAPEAVAVSFVTEAELRDATTGAEGGAAAPAQQPTPQAPAAQPPQPAQPAQPSEPVQPQQAAEAAPPPPPEPKAPAETSEATPPAEAQKLAKAEEVEAAPQTPTLRDTLPAEIAVPEREAEKPQEKKQETQEKKQETQEKQEDQGKQDAQRTQEELTKEKPDLLALPDPAVSGPPNRNQQAKKPQKQAMRAPDMMLPGKSQNMTTSLDGRSAGIERPAGITRSGANDDFARGVIRALRQTMPQMSVLGRVTVRILINMNGNIESVEVVNRSDNSDLNRAVVFSTKQASFPFPPNGATIADRTFTITYIYH